MKNNIVKTVLIGFLMTVFCSAAFAEMNLGLHVGVAHSDFVAYNKNNTSVKDLNFNFSALQVKDSGLALKYSGGLKFPWGENAGLAARKAISGEEDLCSTKTNVLFPAGEGFGLDFNFGIGKVLVRNEKVLVTATAVAGFVFYIASHKYKSDLADNDDKIETTAMGGKFGADLTGIIHLTQKVGLFANFGLYYTVSSYHTKTEWHVADAKSFAGYKKEETSDGTVFNGCTFAPSLGVSITF